MQHVFRIVLLLVFSIGAAFTQHIVSRFPSQAPIFDLRTYPVGDSLLVVLEIGQESLGRSFWLDSSFQLTPAYWVPSSDEFLMSNEGFLYFYSIQSWKNESILHVRSSKSSENSVDISLTGRLLTVVPNREAVQCISFLPEERALRITEVVGNRVIRTVDLGVATDFGKFRGTYCVLPGSFDAVSAMVGEVKVYPLTDNRIAITCDIPRNEFEAPGEPGKTVLYQLDLKDRKTRMILLPTKSPDDFRSVLVDSVLYRVAFAKDRWIAEIVNLDGTIKAQFPMFGNAPAKALPVYSRDGEKNKISAGDDLASLIKSVRGSEPFFSVEQTMDGKKVFTVGTYMDRNGGIGAPIGPTPVLAIANMVIMSAALQLIDRQGLARYIYLTENSLGNLMIADNRASILRRHAEDYEIGEIAKGARIKITRYAIFRKHLLGFYNDRAAKEMHVVDFGIIDN